MKKIVTIELDAKESAAFNELVGAELRRLVNEYDDDERAVPDAGRMKALPALKSVLDRWTATRPTIEIRGVTLVRLDAVVPCVLSLTEAERAACEKVMRAETAKIAAYVAEIPMSPSGAYSDVFETMEAGKSVVAKLAAA